MQPSSRLPSSSSWQTSAAVVESEGALEQDLRFQALVGGMEDTDKSGRGMDRGKEDDHGRKEDIRGGIHMEERHVVPDSAASEQHETIGGEWQASSFDRDNIVPIGM